MDNGVIYARFSSQSQNEQSIEAQVRICKEFAEGKDINIVNIYSDKARTGTNDARPAFQRMIADAKSGAFQYIVVYMFDRFAVFFVPCCGLLKRQITFGGIKENEKKNTRFQRYERRNLTKQRA